MKLGVAALYIAFTFAYVNKNFSEKQLELIEDFANNSVFNIDITPQDILKINNEATDPDTVAEKYKEAMEKFKDAPIGKRKQLIKFLASLMWVDGSMANEEEDALKIVARKLNVEVDNAYFVKLDKKMDFVKKDLGMK